MTDLKALVERIEGAAKNDADLFREVATAVFGSVPDAMNRFLAAGAYLDAAMQLVPEGWIVEMRRYFNSDGEFVSAVKLTDSFTVGRGCHPEEEISVSSRLVERQQGVDPTPLALCAASLRARISKGTPDV